MENHIEPIRNFIRDSLAIWKTPEVAVGIVKGSDILLCEGYGLRNRERNLPVTEKTLFAIGSSTKAFTSFDLGLLVDEGKLDWDKPLRDFLPAFQMYDPVASERLTPRDILSHRVGLPRHDFMWYNAPFDRHQIFRRLRFLEPNKDIRQTFQYQNLMYMAAGVLIEHVTGQTWEEFTHQRIFEEVGMPRSNFSVNDSQKSDDFALPYQEKKDQIEVMPFRNIDSVGPAGSINSCVEDMVKWLSVHVNHGKLGEGELISAGNLSQMHTPQMVIQDTPKWKELLHSSYGLGWFIAPYRGVQMVQHGGNIDGFSAFVGFLPAGEIGVVALCNMSGTSLPTVIAFRVFDLFVGLEPVDWNERLHKEYEEIKAGMEKSKEQTASARQAGHPPSHPLEDYAGEYEHPGYGVVALTVQDSKLKAVFNNNEYQVEPYHYEIFEFNYDLIDLHMKGTFTTDEGGQVSRLALPLEPFAKEIVFERIPELRMSEQAFLTRFVGIYEITGMPLIISLKGNDRLVATFPGQPAYELIPYRGTTYTLKGLTGVSITFKPGESGLAEALDFIQPGVVLSAQRKKEAAS